ncbi:MAG: N-acetylmuramoyl-L-alanine amidase [Planctomycetes bacterium]|nr:N-acetylmuramoyl-L-alanine amidase [Planctomycetota bacterium]
MISLLIVTVAGVAGCATHRPVAPSRRPAASASKVPVRRAAGRLLVAGASLPVGVAITGPNDAGGFDGALERCAFTPGRVLPAAPALGCDIPQRYGVRSTDGLAADVAARVAGSGYDQASLAARIDQVILHYDAAGTSRRCFEVLHDERGLSSHFLLDVDGRLYQTLDLAHRARHATIANDRSIGIEIAHVGAYPDESSFEPMYAAGPHGLELRPAARLLPPPGAPFALGRPGWFRGDINGRALVQPDYTEAQYRTLEALLPELCRVFPRIAARIPRDASGAVRDDALESSELTAFRGVLGHFHVQRDKTDPGPAFDWERISRALSAPVARP